MSDADSLSKQACRLSPSLLPHTFGVKSVHQENRGRVKLRIAHKIPAPSRSLATIASERPDDTFVVIITLYLCFGPCTKVHQNGYLKRPLDRFILCAMRYFPTCWGRIPTLKYTNIDYLCVIFFYNINYIILYNKLYYIIK